MADRPMVDWEGEKSGFDDFEITITNPRFGKHPKFRNGEATAFIMTGTVKLPEGKIVEDSDQFFGIGKFDAVDNGARVVHEEGDENRFFHQKTGYIDLLTHARKCGAPIEERCQNDPLNARSAHIWQGLKFRMMRVDTGETFEGQDGETVNLTRLRPVEYLGEVDGAGGGGSNESAAASSDGSLEDLLTKFPGDQMGFIDAAIKGGHDVAEADALWKKSGK